MLTGYLVFGIVLTIVAVRAYRYAICRIRRMSGVEQNYYIDVRGTKQHMQFRGNDVNNPIILMLNPGNSKLQCFMTYRFRKELIDEYTVVYWDQRGCGRTYFANKRTEVTYSDLFEDLEVVVDYLCKRFHRDKIILLGYDWGSLLAVDYIKRHPEKIQAYISVEQFIDLKESLQKSTERAMNMFAKNKRREAHRLFQLLSKANTDKVLGRDSFGHYFLLIKSINAKLYPVKFTRRIARIWQIITSPDLEPRDLRWIFIRVFGYYRYLQSFEKLIAENFNVNIVNKFGYDFEVPFYLLYGECDYFVYPDMIMDFYQKLNCPRKNLVELLHSGHEPFLDDPASFCSALKNILNEVR